MIIGIFLIRTAEFVMSRNEVQQSPGTGASYQLDFIIPGVFAVIGLILTLILHLVTNDKRRDQSGIV